jgi:hypothetical protein
MMTWFWFTLLILSNIVWYLIYDALKKIIKTYRRIIESQGGLNKEVLERLDEISDDW